MDIPTTTFAKFCERNQRTRPGLNRPTNAAEILAMPLNRAGSHPSNPSNDHTSEAVPGETAIDSLGSHAYSGEDWNEAWQNNSMGSAELEHTLRKIDAFVESPNLVPPSTTAPEELAGALPAGPDYDVNARWEVRKCLAT